MASAFSSAVMVTTGTTSASTTAGEALGAGALTCDMDHTRQMISNYDQMHSGDRKLYLPLSRSTHHWNTGQLGQSLTLACKK
jgi:hypothetical protein